MQALILILASILPARDTTRVDYVDGIEINTILHFDAEKKSYRPSFTQVIFWRLGDSILVQHSWQGYRVVAWRMLPCVESTPEPIEGGYRLEFLDGKDKEKRRVVYSLWYVETASTVDPEVIDREVLPEAQRRGLR